MSAALSQSEGAPTGEAGQALTDQQAHEMAVNIRGAAFAQGAVDWQTVTGITARLLAIANAPRSVRARAAAASVALIRRDERGLLWRGAPVSLETLAAVFDVLSDGKHRGSCPDSPSGHHEWAASEVNPTGSTPVRVPLKNRRCQRCGLQG